MAHRLPKDAGDESGESSITLDDGGANVQASTTGITTTTGASTREKEYVESSREDLKAEDVEEKRSIEEAAPSAPPAMDYPEGGWRAYLSVAGGCFSLFSTFGLTNSFGLFQAVLQKNQLAAYSPSEISWIGSVGLCFLFLLGLPAGRLFDAGHFRLTLLAGSILSIVGCFCLAVSKTYYQVFLSYSICSGVASGLVFSPTVGCVGTYFLKRRAMMIGIPTSAAALGAVLFPLIIDSLLPSLGFEKTLQVVGYVITGCFVLANVLMRPRDLPRPAGGPPPIFSLMRSFLREPATWLIANGVALCIGCAMWIPMFYVQEYVEVHSTNEVLIKYCLCIMNSGAVIGRLSAGIIADRYGTVNTVVPFTFVLGFMGITLLATKDTVGTCFWLVIFGFATGGLVTLVGASLMSLATSVREIGVRLGLGFIFVSVWTLFGSPIAGALLTRAGGFWAPLLFGTLAGLLGCGLLVCSRFVLVKRKKTWKV